MAKKKTVKKTLKKSKAIKLKSTPPVLKTSDLPVTQLMLTTVHKQIKASINSLEKKQEARFNHVDARFNQVDARFNEMESTMQTMMSEMQRIAVLMEEQNSRNKFVLDGYASLYERQDRVEARVDAFEKDFVSLVLKRNETKEN